MVLLFKHVNPSKYIGPSPRAVVEDTFLLELGAICALARLHGSTSPGTAKDTHLFVCGDVFR